MLVPPWLLFLRGGWIGEAFAPDFSPKWCRTTHADVRSSAALHGLAGLLWLKAVRGCSGAYANFWDHFGPVLK